MTMDPNVLRDRIVRLENKNIRLANALKKIRKKVKGHLYTCDLETGQGDECSCGCSAMRGIIDRALAFKG